MGGNVREISGAEWQTSVAGNSKPVLVDFFTTWCGPCRWLAPMIEQLSEELAGKLDFVKVDGDKDPDLVNNHLVEGFPTLVLFKGGKEVDRIVGAAPKPIIAQWLGQHLPASSPAS